MCNSLWDSPLQDMGPGVSAFRPLPRLCQGSVERLMGLPRLSLLVDGVVCLPSSVEGREAQRYPLAGC